MTYLTRPLDRRAFLAAAAGCAVTHRVSAQQVVASCIDQEKFLLNAKVIKTRDAGSGITGTQRLTLQLDDRVHDASWQIIDEYKATFQGERGTEMNFRDTYKYNIAAYQLDRLLDLNMLPVSVKRNINGHDGALSWWVDDVMMTGLDKMRKKAEPPNSDRWNHQMYVARVFDQLIANTDRNLGNFVITKDWTVWLIDHTRAFRALRAIQEKKNLTHCDTYLLERLRALDSAAVQESMKPLCGKFEIEGLLKRRDLIVDYFEKKMASGGKDRVLFDYLSGRKAALGRA